MKTRSVITKKLLKFVFLPSAFIFTMFVLMNELKEGAVQKNKISHHMSLIGERSNDSQPISNISKGMDKKSVIFSGK